MLEITALSKVFNKGTVNEKQAMSELNLTLKDGDFVTVIGSNGAGKSTLFNLIGGTFYPDSGKIILAGKDITYLEEYKRAHDIGRIFQDPMKGTAPSMTVEENLALSYMSSKKKKFSLGISKQDSKFFREQLSRLNLGLEDRMKSPIGLLSGGQRQAITLLMCTMVTPKLLLLDEHTAALDPATAEKVLEITKEVIHTNKITTMMITHNISSALKCGNRTIMMSNGRIILDLEGEEREKMTVPHLLELFKEKSKEELDNDRMLLEE